jgi:hypothetical protein
MSNGWITSKPDTDESYDVVARDPLNHEWKTFQVKSIRIRADRGNELVIMARKGNGEPYSQSDADYIIGVLGAEEGTLPRVYMFVNRGLGEYWSTQQRAEQRWVRLPIDTQREFYTDGDVTCPA